MMRPMSLQAAQELCTRMATQHYENFPVGSRFISKNLRPDIHAIYAFARTADDFADEAQFEGRRLDLLQAWRERLQDAARGEAKDPVFLALSKTIQRHQLPIQWLDDLLLAFEQDVRQSRHETFDSIMDYAKRSANPVGRLVLWVHGYRDEKLFEWSDFICTALQFANFWQDIAVDLKKDRIYLPLQDLNAADYTIDDLNHQVVDERFYKVMHLEIERTWDLFWKGRPLCDHVGQELQKELKLVWLGGTRILKKIEKNRFDVFRRRPTLKADDKLSMIWHLLTWKKR